MKRFQRLVSLLILAMAGMGFVWCTDLGFCNCQDGCDRGWEEQEWYAEAYCFLYKDCSCMPYGYYMPISYQPMINGTADYWLNEANRLYLAGNYEQAAASYAAALELDPSLLEARLNMGNALYFLNRHQESLEAYNAVLSLEPLNPNALQGKRLALLALNRSNENSAIL